jgi:Transcriptional regulator
MPKHATITKKMIDEAAFNVVRRSGLSALTARNIADELNCSTQPIYSVYRNMSELKKDVMEILNDYIVRYVGNYKRTGQVLLDAGLGYINFAKTEKILFQSFELGMRDPGDDSSIGHVAIRELMEAELKKYTFSKDSRDRIFLQIVVFTYGLAVLNYLNCFEYDEEFTASLIQNTFDSYVKQESERRIT